MQSHADTSCQVIPRAEAIARLNDRLRKSGLKAEGGKIVLTPAVLRAVGRPEIVLEALAAYDEFDDHQADPMGCRDFGDFVIRGFDCLWKIAIFDSAEMQFASDDPANPEASYRVLTVLRADEF